MSTLDDSKEYIILYHDHSFKLKSLEDNIYFTLRDMFLNLEDIHNVFDVNDFNSILTDGICYEEREDTFTYANVLQDKNYVDSLSKWLSTITQKDLNINTMCEERILYNSINIDIDISRYMPFEEWWQHFENLRLQINKLNK